MPFWPRSKRDEYLADARKFRKRGEFDRAGDAYYQAGEIDDAVEMYVEGNQHARAAKLLDQAGNKRRAAELYAQGKEYRSAAALYEKVDPRRASALYEKLGENFKAAQIEERLRGFRRAAELYRAAAQWERAAANFARDSDFDAAARCLEEHIKSSTGTVQSDKLEEYWGTCADFYRRAGHLERAAEIWERTGKTFKAAEAFEGAGEVSKAVELFLRAGEGERAFAAYQRAPDGALRPAVLADLLHARGDDRQAAQLFRDLGEHARAAECFDRAGERRAAAEQYELAGELELAADLFYADGEHARASRLYEGAMRTLHAARAAFEGGDHERAATLFEAAQEPLQAAVSWRALGDLERTIAVLQQVPASDERHSQACVQLAEAFREKGLPGIAMEKYQVAIAGQPVDVHTVDAYYGMALLHEQLGEIDKSAAILQRIVANDYNYRDAASRLEGLNQRLAVASSNTGALPRGVTGPRSPDETLVINAPGVAATGQVLPRYEIVGRMGASARGEVYKAWDASLGRTVVLKRLTPRDVQDEGLARRYVGEAKAASKLHHTNIATIYDAVDGPEGRLVAMEYVFGGSLRGLLEDEHQLTPGRTLAIVAQILLALDYAHEQGVTHRNLRPENVLLGEKNHVKLTDFGMNRRYSDLAAEAYDAKSPLHYLCPEQIRGGERDKLDRRADIYAVGCMLYEMLVGRPPFVGEDCAEAHLKQPPVAPSQIDPKVPAQLDAVVLRCLQKEPADRYGTAREVHDALRAFDFVPGQRIGERYELVREIGAGGMGKVFLAIDLELEERIAMKILRRELGSDPNLEARFIREIKLARKIVHPAVVKTYDFGKVDDVKYITMEFIDGISLDEYVARSPRADVAEVARFAVQICEALAEAHRLGVIHRDIKPQNILISSDGRVKIVDFGIARFDENEDLTGSRHIIGSPKYMSPEQITGRNVDHRTDLYALGAVMYFAFTGIEPFTAADTNGIIMKQLREQPIPPCQVNPDLPPWVEMVVLKCLVKDPRGRYQSAEEVARDIRANLVASA